MLPATHRNSNSAWLPSVLGDFFDDNFFTFTPARQFASPAVNILENEKQFEIEVAAPGMTRNDFNIHLDNDAELVISLEKKSDKEDNCGKEDKKCKEEKRNYLRREFSYASYRQSFSIPEEVDV